MKPERLPPFKALEPGVSLHDALMMAFQPEEYDATLLAKTGLGEARGEGPAGIEAVMHVIANRVANQPHKGVEDVVKAPKQFSAWNEGDPNREFMDSLAPEEIDPIVEIAKAVLSGKRPDPTGGATHYFAPAAVKREPNWAESLTHTGSIGGHKFFKPSRRR